MVDSLGEIALTLQPNETGEHSEWVFHYYMGLAAQLQAKLITPEQFAQKLTEERNHLEKKSDHDGLLDNFLNNKGFTNALEKELKKSRRIGQVNGILLALDIDNLKQFNDKKGHPAGDELIKAYGRVIQECTRGSDLHGRLGGDEFGVFLVNTELKNAQEIAERIRNCIIDEVKKVFPQLEWEQTVSIGIASANANDNVATLREKADQALYQAKKTGKNKAVIAPLNPSQPPL